VAEPVPPGLAPQMAVIAEVLRAVGVDQVGVADHEAEDVIATWSALTGGTVEVVSGDRDLFALVEDPRVRVLYPEKGGLAVVDEAEVTRRYGVPGRRYADFAVLRGDPSDGLPGLRGVGAAKAAELIRRHGGLAEIIRDAPLGEADRDYLARAMQVVEPVLDLPITLPAGRRDRYPADPCGGCGSGGPARGEGCLRPAGGGARRDGLNLAAVRGKDHLAAGGVLRERVTEVRRSLLTFLIGQSIISP
jgi:hypothetical protein